MPVRHKGEVFFIHIAMDWQLIVPNERGWREAGLQEAWEVRLRVGQGAEVIGPAGAWQGSHLLTPAEVAQAAQALSGHSLAAHGRELKEGFLPLPGGHRLGVCGVAGPEGFREITSLCVRLAHQVKGVGDGVFSAIRGRHTLIIGPPGAGKTTLLRDLVRLYSLAGVQVALADSRGEIAACREGRPQLDVGPRTDVLTGLEKAQALMLLIRSMGPQVAAADEIGGEEDAKALLDAIRCGVTVLTTAHGRSLEEARQRGGLSALFREKAFEAFVVLENVGKQPRVTLAKEREEPE